MKYACDVCEKVAEENKTGNWLTVKTEVSTFKLCDECQKKFWDIFRKEEPKENKVLLSQMCEGCKGICSTCLVYKEKNK